MLTVRSTINIASQTVPPIIPVVQGDTGRAILFTLADFTIPTGATATYYVQKPSGEAVYNNATIDGNNVLVELTAQSIIEKGDNYGQVRIAVGEDVVTSFDFILLVKEFRGIDAVQSLTEMNIFDKAVEQAADAIDDVKTDALDDMDSAKTAALDDIGDAKDAALQEIEQTTGNFADDFSASATYAAGDYVMHSGQLYRFTANHAAGAWTGSDAEAVTVGEELTDLKAESTSLKEEISQVSGLSEEVKVTLLQIAQKVAYVDAHGQDYYDDLYDALYAVTAIRLDANSIMLTSIGSTQQLTATTTPAGGTVTWASSDTSIATVSNAGLVTSVGYGSCTITASSGSVSATCAVAVSRVTLTSISADYQQSGTVYDTASLDSLKNDLTVTATYSDSSTATVTEYTLSGTLTAGTSTITVSYGGKTTTFTVTVTATPTLTSISAVYTQTKTIYTTDDLDELKSDLVVTAHMSDSTTQTVTDYVLSGTLTVGTSTITVSYGGKTTTFTVTVTERQIINITYTQGSIGAGNTDANRVSGVITSDIHFDDGESMVISVESGYSVFPFGFIPNADPNSAGTKVSSSNNVLNAYVVSDSSYVVPGLVDMNGTLYANTKSLNNKGDAGWMTGTVTYTFTKTGQYGYTFTGLGFLVKENNGANITPSDIEPLITINKVEA